MTRRELHDKMLQSGDLERPARKNESWKEAFEAYKKATGDHHVSMDCGTCYGKVKKWLTKP